MDNNDNEFKEIIGRHKDFIWHICSSYRMGAAWEVSDLFQEVLTMLWRYYPQFDGRSSERTWIYRVATNTLLSLKRKVINLQDTNASMPEQMDNNVNAECNDLMRLIEILEEKDYRIVKAHLDGFDYAEIAEMVGISVAAVSMRLSRAKRKLRKMYEYEK